ncbi:hypothetical protein CSB20_03575 [bacterium DOLZORAL124_64_63]|nr:MAG: hypothetical protein CSB20_03575 [bacterium DOLZORAL124_64_63]
MLVTGLLLLVGAPARASLLRLYGGDNVGTASGQFLRIPVGARAVALGKAYVACATDGAAAFWNPAGIMRTPGRTNYFASHSEYTADMDLEYLGWHHRRQNFGYALSLGTLLSGDILRTDEFHQEGTGDYFNANQFYLGASLARAMTDRFSIGMTVKYYQENLDEFQTKALLADLGILYFVGLGDTRIGFSVRNFGSDLRPGGTPPPLADGYVAAQEFQAFPAPTVGTFGAARTWRLARKLTLLTTADFNHPSDYSESFRVGTELGLRRMLFLRAGYETSRDEGGFAAGFGLELKRKQFLIRVDYAYSDNGSFGAIHHVSVNLSPLHKRKPDDAWRRRSTR